MKKWSVSGACVVLVALSTVGCGALLGLDDKSFDGTGGATTTTGGAAGTMASGGTTGSGATTSAGGTTASGGTTTTTSTGGTTGGTGGTTGGTGGAPCLAGADPDHVTDDFEFPLCGDTAMTLKARGWHLAWQDEMYAVPPVGLLVAQGELQIHIGENASWFDGEGGPFIEKLVSGAFLIVTDVKLAVGNDPASLPQDARAGAGLMLRDPESAGGTVERWLAVDRGSESGAEVVHGMWSNGVGDPDQGVASVSEPASGKVALCRDSGGQFHIWTKSAGAWQNHDALVASFPQGSMPDTLQAGVFLYAYDNPKLLSIPGGVKGTFQYVRQYDLAGACNPADYGE